jgi:hypothetical protein
MERILGCRLVSLGILAVASGASLGTVSVLVVALYAFQLRLLDVRPMGEGYRSHLGAFKFNGTGTFWVVGGIAHSRHEYKGQNAE